jgi:transcriptional regulator with XRE-family HTH domain
LESNKKFQIKFGERLKRIRESKELSLRDLATKCNLDFSKIGQIEKGNTNLKLSSIIELSRGLGVHPKELLEFDID